jgi:hypothetical protein
MARNGPGPWDDRRRVRRTAVSAADGCRWVIWYRGHLPRSERTTTQDLDTSDEISDQSRDTWRMLLGTRRLK